MFIILFMNIATMFYVPDTTFKKFLEPKHHVKPYKHIGYK